MLFNIKLPINFNSPYKATDIQDFWRRWHITLSRFLRDYIYIPLGGNRKGGFRTYNNLMITFLLGGLWHGAGWTFVFWGFLHGVALSIHRAWSNLGFKMWTWLAWLVTFNFVNITWIFFRAKEWDDAVKVLKAMFNTNATAFSIGALDKISVWLNFPIHHYLPYHTSTSNVNEAILLLCLIFIPIVLFFDNSNKYVVKNKKLSLILIFITTVGFTYSIISSFFVTTKIFLYFNF